MMCITISRDCVARMIIPKPRFVKLFSTILYDGKGVALDGTNSYKHRSKNPYVGERLAGSKGTDGEKSGATPRRRGSAGVF